MDPTSKSDQETMPKDDSLEILDTPLFPLKISELKKVMLTLCKSATLTAIGQVCGFIAGLVCIRFVGKYGTAAELAGTSLGFTWSNVFCLGIITSINQGFSIDAAHLFGAKKYRELGVLYQRNLCVLTAVLIPLLTSLYFADSILISIGLDPEVSINTGIYLRYVMPSLIASSYFDCTRYYLIAQNYFAFQPIIQGSLAIVHIFWCYLFVDAMGLPVEGVAIAKSLTDLGTLLFILMYIKFSHVASESWMPWDKECLYRWWYHLKHTLTIGANVYIEWISYELSLFIIGIMNDKYILGAHGVAITITAFFFMFPYGNSASMQAYIGNAVGEGAANKAQKFVAAGLTINALMTSMNSLTMLLFHDWIADFFTNDENTKEILSTIVSIYAVAHIADTNVNHLTSILRTVGREKQVLAYFSFCYIIIGLNFEWIFGIAFGFGYKAVWFSIGFAMYLMFSLMASKLIKLDWNTEVQKVYEQINNEMIEDEKAIYIELKERA